MVWDDLHQHLQHKSPPILLGDFNQAEYTSKKIRGKKKDWGYE